MFKSFLVLVVDDSDAVRRILTTIIVSVGHDVLTASDGREALGLLERHTPDLIVSDFNMPEMNGSQFIRKVRRLDADRPIPVIILTSETSLAKRAEMRRLGVGSWIVKPIDVGEVLREVNLVARPQQACGLCGYATPTVRRGTPRVGGSLALPRTVGVSLTNNFSGT